jgi:hypothetical protein
VWQAEGLKGSGISAVAQLALQDEEQGRHTVGRRGVTQWGAGASHSGAQGRHTVGRRGVTQWWLPWPDGLCGCSGPCSERLPLAPYLLFEPVSLVLPSAIGGLLWSASACWQCWDLCCF